MRGTQPLQPALYLYTWFVFCVNPDNQIEFVTLVFFFDFHPCFSYIKGLSILVIDFLQRDVFLDTIAGLPHSYNC